MKPSSEDLVRSLLAELLRDGSRSLTLDQIGEAIGDRSVGSEEVDLLLTRLEEAGVEVVGTGEEGMVSLLREVIRTAHLLRREGAAPTPTSIATRSGISVRAVRVALLYADVLKG